METIKQELGKKIKIIGTCGSSEERCCICKKMHTISTPYALGIEYDEQELIEFVCNDCGWKYNTSCAHIIGELDKVVCLDGMSLDELTIRRNKINRKISTLKKDALKN